MMNNGFWLGDVYIVDYPPQPLVTRNYDEETAKKITAAAQEHSKWLRDFIEKNDIKFYANGQELFPKKNHNMKTALDQLDERIEQFKRSFPELYSKTFHMTGGSEQTKFGLLCELVGFDISQFLISHAKASISSQSDIQRSAMMGILIGIMWKASTTYSVTDMNFAYVKASESILRGDAIPFKDWIVTYDKQPPTDEVPTVKPNQIDGADFALWLRTVGVTYFAVKQLDPDLTEGWQIKGSQEEYSDQELFDLYLKSKNNES